MSVLTFELGQFVRIPELVYTTTWSSRRRCLSITVNLALKCLSRLPCGHSERPHAHNSLSVGSLGEACRLKLGSNPLLFLPSVELLHELLIILSLIILVGRLATALLAPFLTVTDNVLLIVIIVVVGARV